MQRSPAALCSGSCPPAMPSNGRGTAHLAPHLAACCQRDIVAHARIILAGKHVGILH